MKPEVLILIRTQKPSNGKRIHRELTVTSQRPDLRREICRDIVNNKEGVER
jgi:hypothetical protein